MHVPRSFQSTNRVRQSAPTSSTFFAMPDRTYAPAVMSPRTKPLHAAVRSMATALLAPKPACTVVALPNTSSGVDVHSKIMSTSSGATRAISSARRAASVAW